MHIRPELMPRLAAIGLAAAMVAGCQASGLDGVGASSAPRESASDVCLDYQPCIVSGTLRYRALGGARYEAAITRRDGTCVPLLLSERQKRAAAGLAGRAVTAEGLALVRLADGGPETLDVAYFDRGLSTGACDARTVLYTRALGGRRR